MKPKKEQGYVGVLYTEDRQVLGYAFKPETKKLWDNAEHLVVALQELVDSYNIETIAKAYKAIERVKK
jgi:hypothetical protein